MQLWIYHSAHSDGALSFILLFTDYDGINYGGVFIGQKDQNNRKECYWTLCTVTFAKTWTKQTIPPSKGVFERRTSTGITCNHAFLLPFLYGRPKGKFNPLFRPPIYALSAKKERLIAGYNRKWVLFLLNMPWRYEIGHFRVPKTLTFKMRLGAQPFLWKWVLFAWEWKMISISKAEHLPSFWNRGPGQLGNGLLVSPSVLSLIEAIGLNILAKPLHKNTKQLLPTDVLHSKSPLARVRTVARVSWMYLVYILLNRSQLSAIHYSNKWLSQRCFLFSEQSGRLFLICQGTQGTEQG